MRTSVCSLAALSLALLLNDHHSFGFATSENHVQRTFSKTATTTKATVFQAKNSANAIPHDDDDEKEQLVTREMLQRDLLNDPSVKRKNKKGKGYQPLDNRDHLPFAVKQITPDPYTHPDIKRDNQVRLPRGKESDLEMIGARLSLRRDDTSTFLGEFQLDKSTTSGDIIELANGRQYKVQKASCQYKYAGGQRFVMVRHMSHSLYLSRRGSDMDSLG